MHDKHSLWSRIALLLTIVGAINWGLVGLLEFNLVSFLLGFVPMLEKLVYIIVGASGLASLRLLKQEEATK